VVIRNRCRDSRHNSEDQKSHRVRRILSFWDCRSRFFHHKKARGTIEGSRSDAAIFARSATRRDDRYPKGGGPVVGVRLTSSVVPGALKATSLFGEQSDLLLTNVRVRIAVDFRLAVGVWISANVWIAVCVPINVNVPVDLGVPIYIFVPVGLDGPIDVYVSVDVRVFTAVRSIVITVSVIVVAVS
jgi:hypothetical protein